MNCCVLDLRKKSGYLSLSGKGTVITNPQGFYETFITKNVKMRKGVYKIYEGIEVKY